MTKSKIYPVFLFACLILILTGSAIAKRFQETQKQPERQKLPEEGIFFSTEEEFATHGPKPKDGNPIISDGDLLSSRGYVYMRNYELLKAFKVKYDLGLDAVFVVDAKERFVIFSTELDHPKGLFTAGDLLTTNGAILPNSSLLKAFDIPSNLDLGLDAVHLTGGVESIKRFFKEMIDKSLNREFWLKEPKALLKFLKRYRIDIWFSTEGTAPLPNKPIFLDGDLLSASSGTIILSNHDALPMSVPAGILNRGVDFGLDAVTLLQDSLEKKELLLFSTELDYPRPRFTDGDVLIKGNGVIFYNASLISAFEPKVKDLGLDALSFFLQSRK